MDRTSDFSKFFNLRNKNFLYNELKKHRSGKTCYGDSKVDHYKTGLFSSRSSKRQGPDNAIPWIHTIGERKKTGTTYFYADGANLAQPEFDSRFGLIYLNMHMAQFHAVCETLSQAKPVQISYLKSEGVFLATIIERTGEEESIQD